MRKVLITGGNRGLGYKLSEVLSPNYHILLTARQLQNAEEAKKQILQLKSNAKIDTFELDVSRFDSILEFHKKIGQIEIDVLVNNAGVNDDHKCPRIAHTIMQTNLFGVINLTETLLPQISKDGKILIISSNLGKLQLQPRLIKEKLNQPMNKQEILKMGRDLIEAHETNGSFNGWSKNFKPIYCASKALVNAYGRYVLPNLLTDQQSSFNVHPGWLKTDMGGKEAPQEIEEGVITSTYLINQLEFGNTQYTGKYFNEKAKLEEY